MRSSIGVDVHRFVEGKSLVIGGVQIDFDRGLKGHSDGDVLTHAIIDSLLGGAALGDIGTHFPSHDDSFKNIIPGWITNLDIVADPIKSKLRELAIANLLNAYGGFFVPSSFLCMKNLIDLYENGTKNDKCLVGEMQSTSINASKKTYTLSPKFLATKKNSPTINAYIEFLQRMVSTDYTNESIFIGETSNWFQDNIKNVNKISAKKLGVANIDGEPIMIEDLVGNSFVSLDDEAYGVYIPTDIVLNRTAYQWLARMSPEQIYNSDTFVGKVSLIA